MIAVVGYYCMVSRQPFIAEYVEFTVLQEKKEQRKEKERDGKKQREGRKRDTGRENLQRRKEAK
jgi:hypothetical protein